MRYLSVCSGIEAASVAWHPLGWTPVGFSEIEPFPSAVLKHRFPNVPNHGDMTKYKEWPIEPGTVDVLVGGTPCQSFSVAGLRRGLSDPRGGLMLTYLEIAQRLRPRWVVWENVPGVLSSNGGRDFGAFLGALGELGYGWAYRVLDAQWVRTHGHPHAVPQRRRRVFVVGCLGDGAAAAKVLFESQSVCRDSAPRRAAREETPANAARCFAGSSESGVAAALETTCHDYSRADGFNTVVQPVENVSATIAARFGNSRNNHEECVVQPVASTLGNRGLRSHTELDGHGAYVPVPYDLFQITAPVNRQNRKPGDPCHTLARDNAAHAAVVSQPVAIGTDCYNGAMTGDVAATMGTPGSSVNASGPTVMQAVAFNDVAATVKGGSGERGYPDPSDGNGHGIVGTPMSVRRLTPRECERLQGFPDDWTMIPWRGKSAEDCPDGPRYKALGNSMAVNVMAWIGERINTYENTHGIRTAE